jgi:hypothetical protein
MNDLEDFPRKDAQDMAQGRADEPTPAAEGTPQRAGSKRGATNEHLGQSRLAHNSASPIALWERGC